MNNYRIPELYEIFKQSTGVCIDTRKLEKDNIFFALKGPNFDGNQYAQKALDTGAKLVVIDNKDFAHLDNTWLVDDCLTVLQDLASFHRSKFDIPFIGITGSNGKTTTKELITRVLATRFKIHSTAGNLNNHIGVPLTLLAMKDDVDIAVIEMGANHVGEIASYCKIARPTHAIITNIGTAHIGEFGGRDNIIRGKSELFDFIRKNGGVVFINDKDEVLSNMAKRFEKPVIFPDENCQLIGSAPFVEYNDANGKEYVSNLIGEYNFLNASTALAIGNHFDLGMEKAHEAICTYSPDNNRSQVLKKGSNTIILDAYNANPDSTKVALKNLLEFNKPNKVALLGDMKELGEFSKDQHTEVYDYAGSTISSMWVGQEYADALSNTDALLFSDVNELANYLKTHPIEESAVLIKGSRSMTMEKLLDFEDIWQ